MFGEDDPAVRYIKSQPETVVVESDEKLEEAQRWMVKFQDVHYACDKPSRAFCPARLVEIVSDNTVRLHTPAQRDVVKWAALTYCWGDSQPPRPSKQHLENWTTNILISELPKTIADALTVMRKIGLRFLWVDWLCIVQDDLEEMAKEIAQLPHIYNNSEVTISAARAKAAMMASFMTLNSRFRKTKPSDCHFVAQTGNLAPSLSMAKITSITGGIPLKSLHGLCRSTFYPHGLWCSVPARFSGPVEKYTRQLLRYSPFIFRDWRNTPTVS